MGGKEKWEKWLPMGGKVYDNVHTYHSNSQLTR